jgi:hypothetical protein
MCMHEPVVHTVPNLRFTWPIGDPNRVPCATADLQAEVKRRTEADKQIHSHFDSEIKTLQVRHPSEPVADHAVS